MEKEAVGKGRELPLYFQMPVPVCALVKCTCDTAPQSFNFRKPSGQLVPVKQVKDLRIFAQGFPICIGNVSSRA